MVLDDVLRAAAIRAPSFPASMEGDSNAPILSHSDRSAEARSSTTRKRDRSEFSRSTRMRWVLPLPAVPERIKEPPRCKCDSMWLCNGLRIEIWAIRSSLTNSEIVADDRKKDSSCGCNCTSQAPRMAPLSLAVLYQLTWQTLQHVTPLQTCQRLVYPALPPLANRPGNVLRLGFAPVNSPVRCILRPGDSFGIVHET